MKTIIPIALVLLAIGAHGALHASRAAADDSDAQTRVVYFDINGMVTDSCPVLVEEAVSRIDGVNRVDASAEDASVEVEYVVGRTSPEAIRRVIEDQTGFDAEIDRVE